jgi:putative chitinase
MIDAALLQRAVGCTAANAERFAGPLAAACAFYGIDTPKRLAAFLAQLGHESGSFRFVVELWGPTPAQTRYEGRADLGNTQQGDGFTYRGRGLIQTTGRHNYAKTRDRLRERFPHLDVPDFEAEPGRLAEPQWAALSAADYWDSRGLNAMADADQFERITRAINGGINGYDDRLARWERAKAALANEPIPPTTQGVPMTPFIAAALPALFNAIPELVNTYKSPSEMSARNAKGVEILATVAKEALGVETEQEVVAAIESDPEAAKQVRQAAIDNWFVIEAGSGGIDGARKADAERMAVAGLVRDVFKSHSFWIALVLLPLVYMVVGSVIGLWGGQWSDGSRDSIAGLVVGGIIGALTGYYFGQTTSRNRT